MSITATVEDGKITLPKDVAWPSGTLVRVEPVSEADGADGLSKLFVEVAAEMPALPSDLAAQHDHYLYGTPKQ